MRDRRGWQQRYLLLTTRSGCVLTLLILGLLILAIPSSRSTDHQSTATPSSLAAPGQPPNAWYLPPPDMGRDWQRTVNLSNLEDHQKGSASSAAGVSAALQLGTTSPAKESDAASKAKVQTAYGKLPLYFIENRGQLDSRVAYYVQGRDKSLYFTSEGITFALTGKGNRQTAPSAFVLGGSVRRVAFGTEQDGEGAGQRYADPSGRLS